MGGSKAALRYAKALLSLAKDRKIETQVNEDMDLIRNTIAENKDLRVFLKSPVIKEEKKSTALKAIFKDVNTVTSGLFGILLENNRVSLLPLVASTYNRLYDTMHGIQLATVTTAIPLTPLLEEKIQHKVKELTGNTAKIKNIINPNIIGGFILRVGDIQYNASVAAQLNSLKMKFTTESESYISKI